MGAYEETSITSPASIFPEVETSYPHGCQEEGSEPIQESQQLMQNNPTNEDGAQDGCCISEEYKGQWR